MAETKEIGLVLSGGGTRGLAHVGVWRVLHGIGFKPAAIAGCSMGAIVGAMIAAGKTPTEMENFVVSQRALSLFQWPITKLGIRNLSKLESRLMTFIGTRRFEGLKIPLVLNATDLVAGETVVYDRGLLWPAIRASIALPGFLTPVRVHGEVIVDGGVLNEHPFALLPPSIKHFILVNCSPRENLEVKAISVIDLYRTSLNIMQNEITQLRLSNVPSYRYLQIEPMVHGRNLIEGDKKFKELIDLGAKAATKIEPDIRRFMG
jgi:NTE family protein